VRRSGLLRRRLDRFSLRPILFIATLSGAAFFSPPVQSGRVHLPPRSAALAGALIVISRSAFKTGEFKPGLIGAAIGSVLGNSGRVPDRAGARPGARRISDASVPPVAILALMTYCGLIVGGSKGDMLNLAALGGLFGGEKVFEKTPSRFSIPASSSTAASPISSKPDLSTARW